MSEIIDASFFSEYSPKFSPTDDVFTSPRAHGSSGRKPLAGTSSGGIAMSADNKSRHQSSSSGIQKAESPERTKPSLGAGALDVLATVSAEKAGKPKSDQDVGENQSSSSGISSGGAGTNIGCEMDNSMVGINVSGELYLSSPIGQADTSMAINDDRTSLHNLSLSALEPLGMDDSHVDTDTDSPLLGARLNDFSVDRTGNDTSSICLSSSLADVSKGQNTVVAKRKLQNLSGFVDVGNLR